MGEDIVIVARLHAQRNIEKVLEEFAPELAAEVDRVRQLLNKAGE